MEKPGPNLEERVESAGQRQKPKDADNSKPWKGCQEVPGQERRVLLERSRVRGVGTQDQPKASCPSN